MERELEELDKLNELSKDVTDAQRKDITVFFISDGTGITAEIMGNSLLSQFDSLTFDKVIIPFVNNEEKAYSALEQIHASYLKTKTKPIIFATLVQDEIRTILQKSEGLFLDFFNTFIQPMELFLQTKSSHAQGLSHPVEGSLDHTKKIECVNFALQHDDGTNTDNYSNADIVLIGLSRSGKTPTCIYLALQFGIKAANYPLLIEDLLSGELPKELSPYKAKLFGLTIDGNRLAQIRQTRYPSSNYANTKQCSSEVNAIKRLLVKENIKHLDTSHSSIEELAAKIILEANIPRHIL